MCCTLHAVSRATPQACWPNLLPQHAAASPHTYLQCCRQLPAPRMRPLRLQLRPQQLAAVLQRCRVQLEADADTLLGCCGCCQQGVVQDGQRGHRLAAAGAADTATLLQKIALSVWRKLRLPAAPRGNMALRLAEAVAISQPRLGTGYHRCPASAGCRTHPSSTTFLTHITSTPQAPLTT